jgi:hypothetical protein
MPIPAAPPPSSRGPGWPGLALLGIGAIAIVAALRRLLALHRRDEDLEPLPAPSRIVTRTVTDGFWIDSPVLPVGTILHYRCQVDGTMRDDRFTVAGGPSGLFVYTGGTPSRIVILEVLPPEWSAGSGLMSDPDVTRPRASRRWPTRSMTPTPPPRRTDSHPHSQPGRSSYPSAY